jgi:hypothetical protein
MSKTVNDRIKELGEIIAKDIVYNVVYELLEKWTEYNPHDGREYGYSDLSNLKEFLFEEVHLCTERHLKYKNEIEEIMKNKKLALKLNRAVIKVLLEIYDKILEQLGYW